MYQGNKELVSLQPSEPKDGCSIFNTDRGIKFPVWGNLINGKMIVANPGSNIWQSFL
jgi:hypothetical protein